MEGGEVADAEEGETDEGLSAKSGPAGQTGALSLYTPAAFHRRAQVAQVVEQGTENPRVGGSTPSLGTITIFSL